MIIFADESLNIMSFPIEDFTSLTWEESWTEPGAWSITLNPSEYTNLKDASYIYYSDCGWGVVESIEYTRDSFKMSGRELSAILDNYVVTQKTNVSGKLEVAARNLVSTYTNISLGTIKNISTAVGTIVNRGSLMDALYTLLTPRGLGFKVSIDIDNQAFVFDVIKGENRTSLQTTNEWVILSESKGNVVDSKYTRNSRDYKNYVVINVGDDETPTILEYDFRDVL